MISEESYAILADRYADIFEQIEDESLSEKLTNHIRCLPVIGFNSGKYDINVVKSLLLPTLTRTTKIKFVVKRQNNFMSIKTAQFNFLDISNYLAPGYSYAKLLKAFKCSKRKGAFPFEHVTSVSKLEDSLPPITAFHSSLTNATISNDDYAVLQKVWTENKMTTLRDLLLWYNKLDTEPFLEVLENVAKSIMS